MVSTPGYTEQSMAIQARENGGPKFLARKPNLRHIGASQVLGYGTDRSRLHRGGRGLSRGTRLGN